MSKKTGTRGMRRTLQGKVVSDKMDKTVVVQVERIVKHPLYHKFIKRRKRVYAHDEENSAHTGDTVVVAESRPLSRLKRWRLRRIVERAK
jgi:small subunit ribosomal protein S17